jgi:hypothetical protein
MTAVLMKGPACGSVFGAIERAAVHSEPVPEEESPVRWRTPTSLPNA